MAEVPYTGVPSVAPDYRPTPEIHPNVSADAFGASIAHATERSGAAFAQAGNELFGRAIAMQQLDQHAEASNAANAATDAVGKLHMEYTSLEGINAKNGYEPYVANVNKAIADAGKDLTSPYAKALYESETQRMRQVTIQGAGTHAANEFRKYQVGTAQAGVENARSLTSIHPQDEETFNASIAKNAENADFIGNLHGWSREQKDFYKNTENAKTVSERVTTLARTNPQAAQEVLDNAIKNGYVDGETAGKANAFIRNYRNQVTSRVEAGKLLSGEGFHFGNSKVSTDRLYEAIIGVESSGNSRAVTAVTHKDGTKDRALGISQILESNLKPWLKEAGMPSMSADEFLNDRDAQIRLTKFKLGQYQEQYGSANEAARHWRGLGYRDATNGETEPQYLTRFNNKLSKSAGPKDLDEAAMTKAKELAPGDSEFHYTFRDRVFADHTKDKQIQVQEDFDNKHTVDAALSTPNAQGKLPTSIDEIQDPAVHSAWEKLPEWQREKFNNTFARNAKDEYVATRENQAEFNRWYGKMKNPMASDADRKEAMDQNFSELQMPASQRRTLIDAQKALFKNAPRNPAIGHALQVLQPMLNESGITPKDDKETYEQFLGTLHLVMEQKLEETGALPKDEEIRTIGAGMLRDQVIGKGFFGGDKSEKQFKVTPSEDAKQAIIDRYTELKGFAPSEGMIQQIWAAESYNWLYGKKTAKTTGGVVGLRGGK